jgi:hypothetical protein
MKYFIRLTSDEFRQVEKYMNEKDGDKQIVKIIAKAPRSQTNPLKNYQSVPAILYNGDILIDYGIR